MRVAVIVACAVAVVVVILLTLPKQPPGGWTSIHRRK